MIQHLENIKHKDSKNFFLIAGPCAIESEEMAMDIAERIVKITERYQIPYIFKGSFKKANRSRVDSFTGIGDEKALQILKKVGDTFDIPTTTDIHENEHAALAAQFVDVLQIPAFLVRQTDLLVAAAKTNKCVTLKKGQFLSPEAMQFAVQKVIDSGNEKTVTGGRPELIETIAKAGIAVGADGIFIETHPNPSEAKSDGANMLQLDKLDDLLGKLTKIREAIL